MCVNSTCSALCIITLCITASSPDISVKGLQDSALRFVPSAQYPKSIDEKNRHPLIAVLALKTHNVPRENSGNFRKKKKHEFNVSQKNGDLKKGKKNIRGFRLNHIQIHGATTLFPQAWPKQLIIRYHCICGFKEIETLDLDPRFVWPYKWVYHWLWIIYIYIESIYTVAYHSESRWQSPLLKGGVVRGHDKPRIMGVASHLLSRWYIYHN